MSASFTVYLWWLWPYLLAGAVLYVPLNYLAWRSIHNPDPFWRDLSRASRPLRVVAQIVAWPLSMWEVLR